MLSFEQTQFYKPYCRLFAPIAPTIDGINALLETINQEPILIAWIFDCSVGSNTQNLELPQNVDDGGGVGMLDAAGDQSHHLEPTVKLDNGNGFCLKPNGELAFFEFHRNTPDGIFLGLHRLFVTNQNYNLTIINPRQFEDTLRPEDVVTMHQLRNSTLPQRVAAAQNDVFSWLIALRHMMAAAKLK